MKICAQGQGQGPGTRKLETKRGRQIFSLSIHLFLSICLMSVSRSVCLSLFLSPRKRIIGNKERQIQIFSHSLDFLFLCIHLSLPLYLCCNLLSNCKNKQEYKTYVSLCLPLKRPGYHPETDGWTDKQMDK